MSRLCGYCRQLGHTATKCNIKQWQIDSILLHAGMERKAVHDLLLKNGVGLGAIIRTTGYGDQSHECVITSMESLTGDYWDSVVDYRIHKYKKSVRANLRTWTGINHIKGEPDNYYINMMHTNRVYVSARRLDDMSRSVYVMFYLSKFEHRPEWANDKVGYYGAEESVVLCPSSDTDMSDKDFIRPMRLHERLGKDENGYGLTHKTRIAAP